MPTETHIPSIEPILQRARRPGGSEVSFFVTQSELGDNTREAIKLLRKRMKELGFHLVTSHGSCYEFSRGGRLKYYREMVGYLLKLPTKRRI